MVNQTQNISLDSLKTADNQRGDKKPPRLTKKQLRDYWRTKITTLRIEWEEKQNQQS